MFLKLRNRAIISLTVNQFKSFCHIDKNKLIEVKKVNINRYYETMNEDNLPEEQKAELSKIDNNKNLSREEFVHELKKKVDENDKKKYEKSRYKMRVAMSLFIMFLGGFSLWVPLYRKVCESQGFSVKTHQTSYNFKNEKINVLKKYTVKFINEIDSDLPWEMYPLQESVKVNAGETCLIFYKVRNKTDRPIVGLSIYDVHPQALAMYFNKIQCFCFENQLLGPYEEVELPVFFYIDPSVNDEVFVDDYPEIILKYTFYMAKRQDLAKVVEFHMKKNEEDKKKLNQRKIELNAKGRNYTLEKDDVFTPLPGFNETSAQVLVSMEKDNGMQEKII